MASVTVDFDRYVVSAYSPYIQAGGAREAASISCYRGTTTVGKLTFYLGTPPEPACANDTIFLTFPIERFEELYAIVRAEAPLQLWFDPTRNFGMLMSAGLEPIGEQERR